GPRPAEGGPRGLVIPRSARSRPSTTADPLTLATHGATADGAVTACRRDARAARCRSASPLACHLSGGDVEAVPDVDRGDGEDQGRQRRLVVVPGGLVPDVVWYRVRPVVEPGDSLRECQSGALGIGEVGRLPPGRHGEEALVGFAGLLG